MKKPQLTVTPHSLQHVASLLDAGADAFILGEQKFGLRLAGEFTLEEVKQATLLIHAAGKKIFVAMNAIFHNDRVDDLVPYIEELDKMNVDGIVFGDPAIIIARREANCEIPLHWDAETISTNYFQVNYWGKRGATSAFLARELSMEEVVEIKENADIEVEVLVHGMTCMFQSKRSLLGNYFLFQDQAMEVEKRKDTKNMFLHDKERENKYPIYEDVNGTHIFSPNDVCIIDELEELFEGNIDSFKVDTVLHTEEYATEVVNCYRKAIDAYAQSEEEYEDIKADLLEKIEEIQPELRPLDTGFYFKETVY